MSESKVDTSTLPYPGPFQRRFLAPRFWPTWGAIGLLRLLTWLPGSWRRSLGRRLGDMIYRRHGKRRRFVHLNLSWCFPARSEVEREAMARGYFRTMVQTLLDYGVLWWAGERRLRSTIEFEGTEHIQPHLHAGRPVIILTLHSVALDFGGSAFTSRYPTVSIFKEARNPLLDWYIARGRARFGCVLYARGESMRPIVRAVKQGRAFYYLPDEDLGPDRSVFAPLFGIPTATITALSRIARMTGAAVLPYTTVYLPDEGRYVAKLFPAMESFPGDDEQLDAARMNEELEKLIMQAPEQYMWSLRLFQTRPNGEPNPYG